MKTTGINRKVDGKIVVSPKGAELLIKELDKFIVSEK